MNNDDDVVWGFVNDENAQYDYYLHVQQVDDLVSVLMEENRADQSQVRYDLPLTLTAWH